ncbi:MAG: flagellar motor protein MotB [Kordiimonadaceae bacterium]|jgi:chemotaxis protein MotB|nr:flagellar motor protein MotB [Kordiimonadaceae bacterium]
MSDEQPRPIIIKRIKKVSGGAHGGAWKVAYADFVTAMMAFFLMLWLLNSTSKEQKEGLSEYFSPTVASTESSSGAGDILSGISINEDGTQASAVTTPMPEEVVIQKEEVEVDGAAAAEEDSFETAMANREQEAFEDMASELSISIQESAELSQMSDQVLIDVTEDGMRIQLVDQDNRSMFRNETSDLYEYAERMIRHIAGNVGKMPNRIAIAGHTDSTPFRAGVNYSNWELSADRANTARRVLSSEGVSADRFAEITGKAATEPLLPGRPDRPENRRITILVIREAPTLPTNF